MKRAMKRGMKRTPQPSPARRGVALLAALWLVVIIATVALQFSLTAHERRLLGLNASDRARDRAALSGALAAVVAQLEQELRTRTVRNASALLRSADPWIDADSLYSGRVTVGGTTVDVRASDLGATVNINQLSETELRQLFAFVLGDYTRADAIAQSILDWRDLDDLPRVAGGERAEYLREGSLVLPANSPFRDVGDLVQVAGVTPDIITRVRPFLSAFPFTPRINVNSAPEAVLRTLPGMTDVVIANILAMRSAGRRIESLTALSVGVQQSVGRRNGGRGGAPQPVDRQLANRASVDTRDLQVVLSLHDAPGHQSTQLVAVLQRTGSNRVNVRWRQW